MVYRSGQSAPSWTRLPTINARRGSLLSAWPSGGPLVIGQYRGETWLALWKKDRWNFLDLPPLPGERDRPYLRAAAIEVIGNQILLVADRLWRLHPEEAPKPLIPSPDPGAYRAVHWVQAPPQIKGDRVLIQRPWGMKQVWRFNDE